MIADYQLFVISNHFQKQKYSKIKLVITQQSKLAIKTIADLINLNLIKFIWLKTINFKRYQYYNLMQ